jgi:hypothetical protein
MYGLLRLQFERYKRRRSSQKNSSYNKCSIEMFIKLALILIFKRQQHCKLSWLDKDSDKDQSQFDELFN